MENIVNSHGLKACAKSLQLCPTLRPYGLWPTRILCPWGSAGKNTEVGCHFLPPGDLPNPGIETLSPVSPALADRFFTTSATWEAQTTH